MIPVAIIFPLIICCADVAFMLLGALIVQGLAKRHAYDMLRQIHAREMLRKLYISVSIPMLVGIAMWVGGYFMGAYMRQYLTAFYLMTFSSIPMVVGAIAGMYIFYKATKKLRQAEQGVI